jgi:hypothetical protein
MEHTSVDRAERKTEESVAIGVLLELSANLLSQLHCLPSHGGPAHSHGVCINIAAGRASVTIRDVPRGAGQFLRGT